MRVLIPILQQEILNDGTHEVSNPYGFDQKTKLRHLYKSLSTLEDSKLIFILQKSDIAQHHLDSFVKNLNPSAEIIISQGHPMGPACCCLLASDSFFDDEPLIVYNGDPIIDVNMQDVVNCFVSKDYDGGVICFGRSHPHFSFVKLNEDGFVIEAAEKHSINQHAIYGFCYFKRTDDFLKATISMIKKEANINGMYYVCTAYNEMILQGKKIGVYHV